MVPPLPDAGQVVGLDVAAGVAHVDEAVCQGVDGKAVRFLDGDFVGQTRRVVQRRFGAAAGMAGFLGLLEHGQVVVAHLLVRAKALDSQPGEEAAPAFAACAVAFFGGAAHPVDLPLLVGVGDV